MAIDSIPTMPDEVRRNVHEAQAVARETPLPVLTGILTDDLDPEISYARTFDGHLGSNPSGTRTVTRLMLLNQGRDLGPTSSTRDLTEFLWLVYAWGYGKSNFGPSRTRKVLEASAPDFESSAREVLSMLRDPARENPAVDAYYHLNNEGHVLHWGPAFFTKFLTFADPVNQPDVTQFRQPAVILDRWIAAAVNHYLPELYAGRRASRRQPLGRFRQSSWTTPQYAYYLTLVEKIGESDQFASGPYRGRPLAIERALFHYFRDGDGR